jgi:hypothetical protein
MTSEPDPCVPTTPSIGQGAVLAPPVGFEEGLRGAAPHTNQATSMRVCNNSKEPKPPPVAPVELLPGDIWSAATRHTYLYPGLLFHVVGSQQSDSAVVHALTLEISSCALSGLRRSSTVLARLCPLPKPLRCPNCHLCQPSHASCSLPAARCPLPCPPARDRP